MTAVSDAVDGLVAGGLVDPAGSCARVITGSGESPAPVGRNGMHPPARERRRVVSGARYVVLVSERPAADEEACTGSGGGKPAVGELVIDPAELRVLWGGTPVDLTAQEIKILGVLAERAGRLYPFAELIPAVWGAVHGVDIPVVHSAMRRLRRKLSDVGVRVVIESVRGRGFRLLADECRLSLVA